MAHLEINFDSVPDKFLPLAAGVHICRIETATREPTASGDKEKLVLSMKVDDPQSPENGRAITDHISLSPPYGPIKIKQAAKSAGLVPGPGGIDTDDLAGKIVRIRVKPRTYKDKETGELKESAEVAEYLVS